MEAGRAWESIETSHDSVDDFHARAVVTLRYDYGYGYGYDYVTLGAAQTYK